MTRVMMKSKLSHSKNLGRGNAGEPSMEDSKVLQVGFIYQTSFSLSQGLQHRRSIPGIGPQTVQRFLLCPVLSADHPVIPRRRIRTPAKQLEAIVSEGLSIPLQTLPLLQ